MSKEKQLQKIRNKRLPEKVDYVTPTEDYTQTESYKKYIKLRNSPILSDVIVTASDGKEIKISWATGQFRKKISHLPIQEQEELLKRKRVYSKIFMKSMMLKKKAFHEVNRNKEVNGGRKSMLDVKRAEILELFGRMFKLKEVHKIVVEDWGIDITLAALDKYRKKHEQLITQKIEEFKRDYSDIRLSIKKSRLEELVWMYTKRKRIYDATNHREDHKLLLQTLEQVRKESEGEQIRINGKIEFEQEKTIQQHLMLEAFKFLNIKQLVLSRIAAKYRKNPLVLQKSVAESYYRKYLEAPMENEYPGYPTAETYDFEKVVQRAQDRERREKEEEIEDAVIINETKVNDIKTQLINKLKELQGEVNSRKNIALFSDKKSSV